jgi:hypothetical protein
MQVIVAPIVVRYDGQIVKFEADNCFCAVRKRRASFGCRSGHSVRTARRERDHAGGPRCRGVDQHRPLIDERDFFGNPGNLASKLSENLSNAGEALLTRGGVYSLGEQERFRFDCSSHLISGRVLDAYRVLR